MIDLDQFRWLTFDCYGTLIDWESGILGALQPLLLSRRITVADSDVLALYGELEAEAEAGEYRPYREVLREVVRGVGKQFGFEPAAAEVEQLPDSLATWQPFPDTVAALRSLKKHYRLAVISNVDDDLFAHTAPLLQVPFDEIITAQQARSYKPSLNNFRLALERMAAQSGEVLHAAQSLFHDVAPARSLGLATVWVNRPSRREGAGATRSASAAPDLVVSDLASLATLAAS